MNAWVVDASVAVKWYLNEPHSDAALGLLCDEALLVVPDLLFSEVASALWKRSRRRELEPEEAAEWLDELVRVPLLVEPSRPYAKVALELALETGCTPYDSLYLAIALGCECALVTADRTLFAALREGQYGDSVRWIEDVSAGCYPGADS